MKLLNNSNDNPGNLDPQIVFFSEDKKVNQLKIVLEKFYRIEMSYCLLFRSDGRSTGF
ncbi:hypothetical protein LEP1GSC158_4116 [Leptospira interrogans serovar Zanoni str. LT2156]|uniref:Uncharacterized protein n=1 Tax=Leptospira interrogans serovar Zanoni str. LT2156 TaxID=1001601 RepID=M6H8Z4_LEPIR|nr:hypothetical protein LEP1GSC158_4116 [Leptospira interrogans serovar Zanoni str. LT2156]